MFLVAILVASVVSLPAAVPVVSGAGDGLSGEVWTQEAKLQPDGPSGSAAGSALALAQGFVAVGAPGIDSVFVYERTADGWTEAATLSGPSGFGSELAVGGSSIFVGVPSTGSVHIFQETDGAWAQATVLTGDGGKFGTSVDVTPDGGLLVVGARGEATAERGAGAVYVLEQSGDGWTETARLTASTPEQWGSFGWDVSVGPAGEVVGVGTLYDEGTAYVFESTPAGWTEAAELSTGDRWSDFGRAVTAGIDTVLVGAPSGSPGSVDVGAVHVYERGSGGWVQAEVLVPDDASPLERHGSVDFGTSISLDRDLLIVGAPGDDTSPGVGSPVTHRDVVCDVAGGYVSMCGRPGAAYVFERGAEGAWSQQAKLTEATAVPASSPAHNARDAFGTAVAIDADTRTALVGAPHDDALEAPDAGSTIAFTPFFDEEGSR